MFEINKFINEFIKSNNTLKNLEQSTNSLDSKSEFESNKEEIISLPPKEEEFNPFTKEKEKSILFSEEEGEPSERFSFTSVLPPIRDKDSFEENLITNTKECINPNSQNQNILKRKRGRKKLKNFGKAVHGKNDFDNVQRKIKVHFLTFLIDFCNDASLTENASPPFTFKHINYKSKMSVNFENTKELKNSSIKDILNLEISPKYKKFNKFENKISLSKIESCWLNKLFQLNNKELFKLYYNHQEPLHKISFENKDIILSPKTKSFFYLLEKIQNKNLEQKFIETAKSVYFNGNDTNVKPFLTKIVSSDEKKGEL